MHRIVCGLVLAGLLGYAGGAPAADCEPGNGRCHENTVQLCIDGKWQDVIDCAAQGRICEQKGGKACCMSSGRKRDPKACPERGYGTLDVGVGGDWAYVYIDGKKERVTPVYQYRIKAGRHVVELRDKKGKVIHRWDVCIQADHNTRLFHR
ncbi:MAG: hypothetical protein JXR96_18920 [Deltaproteobacteria bacterium]|nr:hypothetical protein [Deltaproteobacteria bacterium]